MIAIAKSNAGASLPRRSSPRVPSEGGETLRFNSQAVRNVVCTSDPCLLLGGPAEHARDDGVGQIVGIAVERLSRGL